MKYKYWLSSLTKVGNAKKLCLLNKGYSPEEIYNSSEKALLDMEVLTEKELSHILYSRNSFNLDKAWNDFLESGIEFTTVDDDKYPKKLSEIVNPPYGLFYIGELPDDKRYSVAMVGARMRSQYGAQLAEKIAGRLASLDINVISGLAMGIDGDSHKGALASNGKTYGVLGNGVDICYPKSNKDLYDKMIKKGGIISEYPPGTQPYKTNFPARNRIISGLSDMTVVVEAKEKSGSLITADFAMEQGRDVFAVPGRITDALSGGCNRLIEQGAGIITSLEEFVKVLEIKTGCECLQINLRKNILEKDETLVYSLLDFRPISIGVMLEKLPFCLSDMLFLLSQLEEKGFIKEIFPNHYVKTI